MKKLISLILVFGMILVTSFVFAETVTLNWTAVADDDNIVESGAADHYELKYATYTITADNFESVQTIIPTGIPKAPGEEEIVIIDLPLGVHYWFAIKVYDEVGNGSLISNIVAKDFFPPSSPILLLLE